MLKRFEAGEILFRQGDPSEHVILMHAGSVDVLREVGDGCVLLGTVGAGQYLGEMGVLEERPRSATARAADRLEVELIERRAFLERVSREPELARQLLVRMSMRLRDVEDRLAGLHLGARPSAPVSALPGLQLTAATYAAKFYVGVAPIPIRQLPFTVGRQAEPDQTVGAAPVDLAIQEPEPYRLSPAHFALLLDDNALVVRDLGSELGTIVDGQPLGLNFHADTRLVRAGETRIVAGGHDSPFAFVLTAPETARDG
jgi:CRP-like cAMP-binding protein